jgi:hypothetical protein
MLVPFISMVVLSSREFTLVMFVPGAATCTKEPKLEYSASVMPSGSTLATLMMHVGLVAARAGRSREGKEEVLAVMSA